MAPPGHDADTLPRDTGDAALRGDLLELQATEIPVQQIRTDRVDVDVERLSPSKSSRASPRLLCDPAATEAGVTSVNTVSHRGR